MYVSSRRWAVYPDRPDANRKVWFATVKPMLHPIQVIHVFRHVLELGNDYRMRVRSDMKQVSILAEIITVRK